LETVACGTWVVGVAILAQSRSDIFPSRAYYDHIMMNGYFETERGWADSSQASDHRPVIADLVLQAP